MSLFIFLLRGLLCLSLLSVNGLALASEVSYDTNSGLLTLPNITVSGKHYYVTLQNVDNSLFRLQDVKEIGNSSSSYKLGDIGPAGGIVFKVDNTGSHGLEAQPADYNKQPGDDSYGDEAYYTWSHAITAGSSYGSGWHLPTKDELNQLYQQKTVVGGFANYSYWSSTELDSFLAWYQYFPSDLQYSYTNKSSSLRVRAVRAF